jgi:hypothetical protein
MGDIEPTFLRFLAVDEDGEEAELPPGERLPSGPVREVPDRGDTVWLNGTDWTVVRRLWSSPIPDARARTPRQAVTLHVRPA